MLIQSLTFNIKPFNRDGHQRFNFGYSTREHYQLDDMGRLVLSGVPQRPVSRLYFPEAPKIFGRPWRLPHPLLRAAAKRVIAPDQTNSQNWAFWCDFDQYLYQSPEDPTQGFGLFGGFGLTPGDWFSVSECYTIGLDGKGMIHERPQDRYGVGYYCLNLSDDIPAPFGVNVEQGVELFYNVEATPRCHITPDLQIIMHPGGGDRDVALVYGLRMQVCRSTYHADGKPDSSPTNLGHARGEPGLACRIAGRRWVQSADAGPRRADDPRLFLLP